MNIININDRSFVVKRVISSDGINDELKEHLKKKYNVKTILKDDKNNLLFVDEIVEANILDEVKNEI